jgi:hypothetical protein
MEQWNSIRQRVHRDEVSIRQIQGETGLHLPGAGEVEAGPSRVIRNGFYTPSTDLAKLPKSVEARP